MSIWDDIIDTVTDETFLSIIGTIATVGTYGGASALLTQAETVAVQQLMNAWAQYETCAINPACIAKNRNLWDAWRAQLVWRTKLAAELGAAGVIGSVSQAVLGFVQSAEWGKYAIGAWEGIKAAYPNANPEEQKQRYLNQLQADCVAANPGDVTKCRADVLALAANNHVGANLFDTFYWDAKTGAPKPRPPPIDASKYTTRAFYLEALWKASEAAGMPPDVLAGMKAAYETEAAADAKAKALGIRPSPFGGPDRTFRINLLDPMSAAGLLNRWQKENSKFFPVRLPEPQIKALHAAYLAALDREEKAGMGTAANGRNGSGGGSLLGDLFVGALLTSPFWVPVIALPWWRKRRSAAKAKG